MELEEMKRENQSLARVSDDGDDDYYDYDDTDDGDDEAIAISTPVSPLTSMPISSHVLFSNLIMIIIMKMQMIITLMMMVILISIVTIPSSKMSS